MQLRKKLKIECDKSKLELFMIGVFNFGLSATQMNNLILTSETFINEVYQKLIEIIKKENYQYHDQEINIAKLSNKDKKCAMNSFYEIYNNQLRAGNEFYKAKKNISKNNRRIKSRSVNEKKT